MPTSWSSSCFGVALHEASSYKFTVQDGCASKAGFTIKVARLRSSRYILCGDLPFGTGGSVYMSKRALSVAVLLFSVWWLALSA